jgi:peroxiredoxin
MKKLLLSVFTIVIMVSCSTEEQYLVKGNLDGASGEVVLLQQNVGGELVSIDSVVVTDGPFEFAAGSVDNPEMFTLMVSGKRGGLRFFIENSDITITGHIDSIYIADVNGSESQDLYDSYNDGLQPLYEKNSELYQEYRKANEEGNEELVEEVIAKRDQVDEDINSYNIKFIESNSASFVTPTVLRSLSGRMETDELEAKLDGLDASLAESQLVLDMRARVKALRMVEIGQPAPDFTQNDVEGNPVTLSEIKGYKLLLIDFWAAWCGPCRRENPNVVAVFNEFNEAGFDVLGVSLDKDKDAWVKAIADDQLDWTQVSDLAYWSNAVAQSYAVRSIPANFLLDSEGTIIARGLRGEDLREKVAELLAE